MAAWGAKPKWSIPRSVVPWSTTSPIMFTFTCRNRTIEHVISRGYWFRLLHRNYTPSASFSVTQKSASVTIVLLTTAFTFYLLIVFFLFYIAKSNQARAQVSHSPNGSDWKTKQTTTNTTRGLLRVNCFLIWREKTTMRAAFITKVTTKVCVHLIYIRGMTVIKTTRLATWIWLFNLFACPSQVQLPSLGRQLVFDKYKLLFGQCRWKWLNKGSPWKSE